MTFEEVMKELEILGNERMKKIYISNGAKEPIFGVSTGAMKDLFKKVKINHQLAEQLYATGNYDAMYFAGMIADPKSMTPCDFDRWIDKAYFPMISDFIVAVTLAEAPCAQSVSDEWIISNNDFRISAGWSCYEWLLGWRPNNDFNQEKIKSMLDLVINKIHKESTIVQLAMNRFVVAVGVSYLPLYSEAVKAAAEIGEINILSSKGSCTVSSALEAIQKMEERGKIGFKRKAVRC